MHTNPPKSQPFLDSTFPASAPSQVFSPLCNSCSHLQSPFLCSCSLWRLSSGPSGSTTTQWCHQGCRILYFLQVDLWAPVALAFGLPSPSLQGSLFIHLPSRFYALKLSFLPLSRIILRPLPLVLFSLHTSFMIAFSLVALKSICVLSVCLQLRPWPELQS